MRNPRTRRTSLGLALICAGGCTSLLGIDADYTLEESGPGGTGGAGTATGTTTADGTGVTTGGDATSGSTSTGTGGTSSAAGGGGAGQGGGGGSGGADESTCDDDEQNGNETDVDCGGNGCPDCEFGEDCDAPTDCDTAVCDLGQCGCPEGKVPGAGGCVCKAKHVECGLGPAAPCIAVIRGPSEPVRLLDDDVDVDPDRLFLAANPRFEDREGIAATYGVLWQGGGAGGGSGGSLARFAADGTPDRAPVDIVPAPAVAVGIGVAGLGYYVLAAGTELNEGISLATSIPGFGESGFDLELTSEGPPDDVLVSSTAGAQAMVELRDGALELVVYLPGQVRASASIAADGVTAMAIAAKTAGTYLLGVAFVRDGDLLFARYDDLGAPLTPIEELEPIDVDDLDLTQPLHLTAVGSRWVVGGTTASGGVVLGVLDAAGELVESVPVTTSSTELGALAGGDDYVHVLWETTIGQRRPWFTRVLAADEPSVIELPFQELDMPVNGDIHVVGTAFLRPDADPAGPEIGVLLHVESDGPDDGDGVYLGRLATCP